MTPPPLANLVKTVSQLGAVGAVIAIWLAYSQTQDTDAGEDVDFHVKEESRHEDDLWVILRNICVNTASDDVQRTACFNRAP